LTKAASSETLKAYRGKPLWATSCKFSVRRAIMEKEQKNTLSRACKFVLKVVVQAFLSGIIHVIIGKLSPP
jgi:hypothetical protein